MSIDTREIDIEEAFTARYMQITDEQYRILVILARRALHTAYVWNDHNFECARKLSKETAKSIGIGSFDNANNFIGSLPKQHIQDNLYDT